MNGNNSETNKQELTSLPEVDKSTANKIWLIIVWFFSAAFMFSVIVLGVSVFIAPPTGGTSSQIILTVVTTIAGFLAGLLIPSPVTK